MYLRLRTIIYYFEKIFEAEYNYLNSINYQIFSEDERQELINTDLYQTEDFVLIPQMERNEIAALFLRKYNNKSLLREKSSNEFFHQFHWYIEDNHLVNEWQIFEQEELLKFAVDWCQRNRINYTEKPCNDALYQNS